ncbi:hypothetical protein FHS29_000276 [Saccharothrix tamanrassetensis]|uniref:Uncharacterized protein n=1 Tax=Saccharothrix tamanrassetensis TaxID=1051531 RepID=A0A841CD78_9PSEU|nr:hypothetical protein [Saccharothrix tamanrassetensis]
MPNSDMPSWCLNWLSITSLSMNRNEVQCGPGNSGLTLAVPDVVMPVLLLWRICGGVTEDEPRGRFRDRRTQFSEKIPGRLFRAHTEDTKPPTDQDLCPVTAERSSPLVPHYFGA